jgi:hypothetical protein
MVVLPMEPQLEPPRVGERYRPRTQARTDVRHEEVITSVDDFPCSIRFLRIDQPQFSPDSLPCAAFYEEYEVVNRLSY